MVEHPHRRDRERRERPAPLARRRLRLGDARRARRRDVFSLEREGFIIRRARARASARSFGHLGGGGGERRDHRREVRASAARVDGALERREDVARRRRDAQGAARSRERVDDGGAVGG